MQIEISQFSWLRFSCCYDIHSITRSRPIRELLGTGWWIRRTSNLKFEILLHRKSTMSSENDETRLWKVMWCRFGDMGSLNLKWGRNSDGHNCRSVDWFGTIQEYISYLLLHARSFESKIRRQGLCLEGNLGDEMERHISEHCIERNEHFDENGTLWAGENDNNANGDERYDIFEELPIERE